MFKKLLDQVDKKLGDERKKKKFHWFMILFSLGLGMMLISSFFEVEQKAVLNEPSHEQKAVAPRTPPGVMTIQQYEKDYEAEMADSLSKLVGVDDVTVEINFESTEEEVLAEDVRETGQTTSERDKTGGNRSIVQENKDKKIAHHRNNQGEKPIVIKKLKPRVIGVLIIARGVENLQVKAAVIEAVQRLYNIPMHHISVLPKG